MATTAEHAHSLALADEVSAAIDALIVARHPDEPPLIDQLADALESSGGHGAKAGSVHKMPPHIDVLMLFSDIDARLAGDLRAAGYRGRMDVPRATLLRHWRACAGRWLAVDPGHLVVAAEAAWGWVRRAREILTPDPQTVETRAQPCPQCGKRTAMVAGADGESVQRPSLYLDVPRMVVYCRCCQAQWSQQMWSWLCRVLSTP